MAGSSREGRLPSAWSAAVAGFAIAAAFAFLGLIPGGAQGATAEKFPKGFMWGVAGSGFQTEMGGGPENSDPGTDWWTWVRDGQNIATEKVSGDLPEDGPGGWATAFEADIKLARGLGLNTWRMGTEWSRIFPTSTAAVANGRRITKADLRALDRLANDGAVARYRKIIASARKAGLKPLVTLNHFTLPLWVHDPIAVRDALTGRAADDPLPETLPNRAGWLSDNTAAEFRKYAAYMGWKFGDLVDWWAPLNEPMVVAVGGYVNVPGAYASWFPPGANSFTGAVKAIETMASANAAAYDELRAKDRIDSDRDRRATRIGLVHNMIHFVPSNPAKSADVTSTANAEQVFNRTFPTAVIRGFLDRNVNGKVDPGERDPSMAGKADFLGVNYYFRGRVTSLGGPISTNIGLLDFLPSVTYRWALNPGGQPCPTICSDFGNEIDVAGLGLVLKEAAKYRLPLMVTENGIADAADSLRPGYLVQSLHQVWKQAARRSKTAPVIGWLHWSLTDNFEWSAGYTPRFGLYSYSPETLQRTARPSAGVVRQIARGNRIPGSLLERWGR
ncbi:MAG: family 1 glycosylhydrolase [Solirubrobacterales bacterium]